MCSLVSHATGPLVISIVLCLALDRTGDSDAQ